MKQSLSVLELSEHHGKFWSCVSKTSGCWYWTSYTDEDGYGRFMVGRRNLRAHRVSFQLSRMTVLPTGSVVRHTCDNPGCVNPMHLVSGTQADNMADKVSKGRQAKGETVSTAKLTEGSVRAIRSLYEQGMTKTSLAKLFSVSRYCIYAVVTRKTWKHVN